MLHGMKVAVVGGWEGGDWARKAHVLDLEAKGLVWAGDIDPLARVTKDRLLASLIFAVIGVLSDRGFGRV